MGKLGSDPLHGTVGPVHALNHPADVLLVQQALNTHRSITRQPALPEDGTWSTEMYVAIHRFQAEIGVPLKKRDGTIRPHTTTWRKLQSPVLFTPAAIYPWHGNKQKEEISEFLYKDAATKLGCTEAAVRAVAAQEGGKRAFDETGRPILLFERHKFRRYTDNAYDKEFPQVSGPQYKVRKKGLKVANADDYYPSNGNDGSYDRLLVAYALDPEAALKSCSWGLFQQMADEWSDLGYPSLKNFVDSMYISVDEHFRAFVARVRLRGAKALVDKDWVKFARSYNGSNEAVYGAEIKAKYEAIIKANPSLAPADAKAVPGAKAIPGAPGAPKPSPGVDH